MSRLVVSRTIRFAVVGLLAASLAACATAPAADLTPPPQKRVDAKTGLETQRY
jgi:hypothetical protein